MSSNWRKCFSPVRGECQSGSILAACMLSSDSAPPRDREIVWLWRGCSHTESYQIPLQWYQRFHNPKRWVWKSFRLFFLFLTQQWQRQKKRQRSEVWKFWPRCIGISSECERDALNVFTKLSHFGRFFLNSSLPPHSAVISLEKKFYPFMLFMHGACGFVVL